MRPMGALLFGHIGDKLGRKTALGIAIMGMGFPTLIIGIIPSYDQIGLLAPIIVVTSRLIQGLFTGGEYNGIAIYWLEQSANKIPAFYSGFLTSSCALGSLIATLVGGYFINQKWEDAWRIPFILGFFLSFLGLWLRYKIDKSPQSKPKFKISTWSLIVKWKLASIKAFSIGSLNGLLSYTVFGFLTIFVTNYGALAKEVNITHINMVGLIFFMVGNPLMGYLYDQLGSKIYLKIMLFILSVGPFLGFLCLSNASIYIVLLGQALFGLSAASVGGITHVVMQDLFPEVARYKGIAFNFSLGMALVGSTASIINLHLIEKLGQYAPSIYVFIIAIPTYYLFAIHTASKEKL